MQYVLPKDITCSADSHYGGALVDNPGGADKQEQFWNCADIYITLYKPLVPTDRPSPDDGGGSNADVPIYSPKTHNPPLHHTLKSPQLLQSQQAHQTH
ncbi:hypothetical protein THRCLA_21927 [Thraustotheca clavata]|uniref:Uncharacterized protein n=1 Tax=Thraustotheca clavata TaxID=74557 RepID=A0A1V9ZHM7_9STRA|nr:hypothetical protein THRCLA_21927 [Thraustotheca clavata]